ncbi:MAG: hypothetical protein Q9225_004676 [Loekoesia sp. 1 TL-2023]
MPQVTALDYQIHLDFVFAYDRATLIKHAYGVKGLSPWELPKRDRLDYAALEHLALLLSSYNIAAEALASGVKSRDVRISTQDPDTRLPHWSIRLGEGKAGIEMYGFQHGTETPFKSANDSHVCCVQLVSPAFTDTDEQWADFVSSTQRILKRLQTPGALHPKGHLERPCINHLAWTNDTCKLTVTVRSVDEKGTISWPTLQNLQAAWGSCAEELARLLQPTHSSPTRAAFRKLIPRDRHTQVQRLDSLYAVSSLSSYLNLESYIAAQYAVRKMSLMTDSAGERCYGLRFEEHRGTLDVAQIQFWTRLTFKAVVACQDMAAAGRRFDNPGFLHFWNHLIVDQWVRDHATKMLGANTSSE